MFNFETFVTYIQDEKNNGSMVLRKPFSNSSVENLSTDDLKI